MKKIIVFFLSFVMMFLSSFQKVNASAVITGSAAINLLKSATEEFLATSSPSTQETISLINDYLQAGGFMSNVATLVAPQATGMIKYLATQIDATQAEKTEQENIACIKESLEHVEFLLDDIKLPDIFKSALIDTQAYYVGLNDYITVYSFNLNENSNAVYWSDTAHLQAVKDLCLQYQDDYYIFYYGSNLYNQASQLIIGLSKENYVFSQSKSGLSTLTEADMYYMAYGLNKSGNAIYGNPAPLNVLVWQYDRNNHVYIDGTWNNQNISVFPAQFIFGKSNVYLGPSSSMGTYWQSDTGNRTLRKGKFISVGKQQAIIYRAYETYVQYPNGAMPYYYSSDVWQDFSTSSGDYTFSPSNINTVSYGDTVSYVNEYYDTHNEYPDNSIVNSWISTTNNNNTSGGGSGGGSGGDDSGGSGGDGDMSIFDFLSKLGEVLGGLIKNLGNMLTSLIEGIVSVITDLLTSIPDTMNILIGSVFGWMPTELKALFALGISLMVLVGLIRLFKG